MKHKAGTPVRDAYNTAVQMLGSFRDIHIQLVSRYIILSARKVPNITATEQSGRVNLATATSRESNRKGFYGTGGTNLIPFLKQTRDTTKAAACYVD